MRRVYVSGEIREIPDALWDGLHGPKPFFTELFVCNGCTLSPDHVFGKIVWPACVAHDYQYSAHSTIDRAEADATFRRNLEWCLWAQGVLRPLAWIVAAFYWWGVRRTGRICYRGSGDPT